MKAIAAAALFLLPAPLIDAQEFEVASIKPSAQDARAQTGAGLHIDGSMARYSSLSLKIYLGIAYRLKSYQISTPDWTASTRWDITAKLPEGSDPKQIPKMLQTLLQDRFQMKMHRETKELPVYGLMIGKGGPKLKESPVDPAVDGQPAGRGESVTAAGSSRGTTVTYGDGSYFAFGDNKFEGKKLRMSIFTDALARFADRPVVDMTNLKGNYDFTMEFSPDDFRAMMIRAAIAQGTVLPPEALKLAEASSNDTLVNAIEKLGLKLEPRKAPVEILIIDQASKTPTEN